MIEELNLQRIDYEEMLINYFTILLISLHRIALQKPRKKNLQNMNDMEQAAQYFRMHYNKPISIEDYAVSHNMSISWFIQNFRQYAIQPGPPQEGRKRNPCCFSALRRF